MSDLLGQVEWRSVEALNCAPGKGVENVLKQGYREDAGLKLVSDTDEQVLLHIPFTTAVKVSKVRIQSAADFEHAPKTVKLFINRPTIGFGEASDAPGDFCADLSRAQLEGEPLQLRVVKFQRINCLTIFVESNQGDEETTVIEKIQLWGEGGDSLNVSEIKDISKQED